MVLADSRMTGGTSSRQTHNLGRGKIPRQFTAREKDQKGGKSKQKQVRWNLKKGNGCLPRGLKREENLCEPKSRE